MRRALIILFIFSMLAGCGGNPSETRHWRFAIEEIPGSVQDAYAQQFKKLIEQKTDGKVQVEVYPYGSLGTSADITEQVRSGALQFAFASPGHLGSVIPEVQVFSLHFLFSGNDQVNERVLTDDPPLYKTLGAAYREKGLDLMAIVPEGWMVWTGNKPLRTPADFKGFKIRTMVSPLLLKAYEAYGANPTPMAYSEVYSGLQLNMIDGQVNPIFAIEEMSFYEVQKAMTFARHLPFIATVITNPRFFDGLPKKLQQTVREVRHELDGYIYDVQREYNAKRLEKIERVSDIQMVHLTQAQREAFRKLSLPVRKEYVQMAGPRGQRILDIIEAQLHKAEAATPASAGSPG